MLGGRGGGRRIPLTNILPKRAVRCSNCGTAFRPTDTIRDLQGNLVSQCPACYEHLLMSSRKPPRLRVVGEPPPMLLLVEDDPGLRSMLRMFFEPLTSEIIEAGTGDDALLIAIQTPPDVIICDQLLVEGEEVGTKLRELLPDCRIVSYSGMDADKPWADHTVTKGTRDDLERLRAAVLPDAS